MSYISSAAYTGAGTANSGTTSITVPTNAKLCVMSWSGYDANDPDWPNPMTGGTHSLGGTNFTFPNTAADATEFYFASALGYIINPATGSQTFSWNHKGTNTFAADGQCFNFAFYDDVVTSVRASAGTNDSTLSSGSPISTGSIASQSGDLLVAECGAYQDTPSGDASFTWGGGVTARDDVFSGASGNLAFADMYATGSHTITCYTNGGQDGTIAAIAFILSTASFQAAWARNANYVLQ